MYPKRLVLSGGGIKVVALVGSLLSLESAGHLKNVKEVCGVSAGAFLAFMIASGYPITKIRSLILELDFSIIRNVSAEGFLGFPETFGVDDGAHLVKFLESMFKVALKMDPGITFAELARKGKYSFRCWATDLSTRSAHEFSASNTPSVKIIDALRASMALPMYFTPVLDPSTGHVLSDGGIQGNLPLHHLSEDECQECLALGFSPLSEAQGGDVPISDLMGFISAMFSCLTYGRNDDKLARWSHKILRIPVDGYPSWNFEASREDREMLFQQGVTSTEAWLQNTAARSRVILRRHSVG